MREMIHPDVIYSAKVVKFFLAALINESLAVRKIALKVGLYIMMQNKPKFRKVQIDPYKSNPQIENEIAPGIREDNKWSLYNSKTVPKTEQDWNQLRYVHPNGYGYYTWPKPMEVYAVVTDQPCLEKRSSDLSDQEKEIFAFFGNSKNVEEFIKYLSLEEKKGKDKFNHYRFMLFKVSMQHLFKSLV